MQRLDLALANAGAADTSSSGDAVNGWLLPALFRALAACGDAGGLEGLSVDIDLEMHCTGDVMRTPRSVVLGSWAAQLRGLRTLALSALHTLDVTARLDGLSQLQVGGRLHAAP